MPRDTTRSSNAVDELNRTILAASEQPDTSAAGHEAGSQYTIGESDLLRVDVFGAETFSGAYRVEPSGTIALPLLGTLPAAGRTPRELEAALADTLRKTYMRDPHVTVQVEEMRSRGVSVLGAVRRPGVYQVRPGTTLLDVLAMAEGLSEGAGDRVAVLRPSAPGATADSASVLEVDLGKMVRRGSTEQNFVVRPGDVVRVRPASFVYVVGEVNRPGGFTLPAGEPIDVLQAVAMAQGLGNTAKASETVIVREHDDGAREEIPVNLDDVLDGSVPPPTLAPRDVLFVPNNRAKSIALGAVDAFVRMVTFRGLFY